MAMRVMVDHVVDGETSLGSPGLGPIRWLRPVRPGDVLRVRVRVVAARPSPSKPDRGTITYEVDTLNQHDEVVMHNRGLGRDRAHAQRRDDLLARRGRQLGGECAARFVVLARHPGDELARTDDLAHRTHTLPGPQMSRQAFAAGCRLGARAEIHRRRIAHGQFAGSSPARVIDDFK